MTLILRPLTPVRRSLPFRQHQFPKATPNSWRAGIWLPFLGQSSRNDLHRVRRPGQKLAEQILLVDAIFEAGDEVAEDVVLGTGEGLVWRCGDQFGSRAAQRK